MARYSSMAVDNSVRACSLLTRLGVQHAEAEVAVGHKRAHAEFIGQGLGLAVVGFGLVDLRGITMRGNVTEEAQGIRLITSFLVGTGKLEGTGGERAAPPPGGRRADAPRPGWRAEAPG